MGSKSAPQAKSVLQAMEQGLKSGDLELRLRCQRLIRLIQKSEEQRRLCQFVLLGLRPGEKAYAGWKRYQKLVGSDAKARQSFAELYKRDPAYAKLTQKNPKKAIQLFCIRCNALIGSSNVNFRPTAVLLLEQSNLLITNDVYLLRNIYDLASSFKSFSVIEKSFQAMVSEQSEGVIVGGKVNRMQFTRLIYLARKVGMEEPLLDTVRPTFANTLKGIVTAILNGDRANNDDFNGVRERTDFAPGLVREDLKAQIRPAQVDHGGQGRREGGPSSNARDPIVPKGKEFQRTGWLKWGGTIQRREVLPLGAQRLSASWISTRRPS